MGTPKGPSDKNALRRREGYSGCVDLPADTKVGEMVSLAALGGGSGVEEDLAGEEGEGRGTGAPVRI